MISVRAIRRSTLSFPFDKIKIDKSFLLDAETSHQARSIIRAVLALGRNLKVPVLAEGLENDAQLRLLKDECCDEHRVTSGAARSAILSKPTAVRN